MNKKQLKTLKELEKQISLFVINNDIDTILNFPAFDMAKIAINAIKTALPLRSQKR